MTDINSASSVGGLDIARINKNNNTNEQQLRSSHKSFSHNKLRSSPKNLCCKLVNPYSFSGRKPLSYDLCETCQVR